MKPTFQNTKKPVSAKAAIWKKLTKEGAEYLSIKVTIDGEEYNISAFANEKKSENSPDFTGGR